MNQSIDDILNEFKNRIRLSDFLGKYLNVEKKGNTYVCRCPFHNEKTPSFSINNQKGLFYCFGCGVGGNVLTFLTKYNNISFSEALKIISNLLGIKVSDKYEKFSDKKSERFFQFTTIISNYFKKNILSHKRVLEYLTRRGIDNFSISKFELGFCGNENISLEKLLSERGYDRLDLIKYGILIETKHKNFFHRFQNRVTFPIYDFNENIVGFGGRTITSSKIKYINSPESIYFKKSNYLFGFKQNNEEIKKTNELIVVEGYMDVISLHSKKIKNTIASLGTNLSENQIKKIWQLVDCPFICFDGDDPGKNAANKLAIKTLKYLQPGKSLKFIELPFKQDPDNFIQKNDAVEFREKLNSSRDLCEIIWENIIEKLDDHTPEYSVLVDEKINDLVKSISNTRISMEYSKFLRERKNNHFWEQRKISISYKRKKSIKFYEDNVFKKNLNEIIILSFLIFEFDISRNFFEQISMINFENKIYESTKKKITSIYLEKELIKEVIQKEISNCLEVEDLNFFRKIRETHYFGLDKKKKMHFFESILNNVKLPNLIQERDLIKKKIMENRNSQISDENIKKYESLNQEIKIILGKEME